MDKAPQHQKRTLEECLDAYAQERLELAEEIGPMSSREIATLIAGLRDAQISVQTTESRPRPRWRWPRVVIALSLAVSVVALALFWQSIGHHPPASQVLAKNEPVNPAAVAQDSIPILIAHPPASQSGRLVQDAAGPSVQSVGESGANVGTPSNGLSSSFTSATPTADSTPAQRSPGESPVANMTLSEGHSPRIAVNETVESRVASPTVRPVALAPAPNRSPASAHPLAGPVAPEPVKDPQRLRAPQASDVSSPSFAQVEPDEPSDEVPSEPPFNNPYSPIARATERNGDWEFSLLGICGLVAPDSEVAGDVLDPMLGVVHIRRNVSERTEEVRILGPAFRYEKSANATTRSLFAGLFRHKRYSDRSTDFYLFWIPIRKSAAHHFSRDLAPFDARESFTRRNESRAPEAASAL